MSRTQIPEKLVAFTVYMNGSEYLGVADVTLPNFEALTTSVSGAGIAGEYDSPSLGHFGSMTVTLNWNTVERNAARLSSPNRKTLDFRGAQQTYNNLTGTHRDMPVRISVRGLPKGFDLGKFETNSTTGGSNVLEVLYIKVVIDGEVLVEFDKLNYIFKVNGVDYLEARRAFLGL